LGVKYKDKHPLSHHITVQIQQQLLPPPSSSSDSVVVTVAVGASATCEVVAAAVAVIIVLGAAGLIPLPKHANSALFTSTPELKL
jgi:hypothetical protein